MKHTTHFHLTQTLKTEVSIFQKLIYFSYLILFFVTPLLISLKSTELFEFPKMLFVYGTTAIIAGLWLIDTIYTGKLIWKKSWIDLLFVIVLITQLISSLSTLDTYTSLFGYYSRFHGGFWSTLCYLLLAWVFKNYAEKSWVQDVIMGSLASASLVSLYGIAEHFGIDSQFWVQDVKNRVFSTLGQPNWLSAWLGALLPFAYLWFIRPPKSFWPTVITLNLGTIGTSYGITYALTQNPLPISGTPFVLFIIFYGMLNGLVMIKAKALHEKLQFLQPFNFLIMIVLMQLAILFTKSRSGILALIVSTSLFVFHELFVTKKIKLLLPILLTSCFLLLVVGTEWTPSLSKLMGKSNQIIKNPLSTGSTNPNISDSTDIRNVVWKGAMNVWQHYPIFGSGTETFAYSYYNFRPVEHNNNSEWDFLYNKAHNEYLNFLANNGLAGTTAILSIILATILICIRRRLKFWSILLSGLLGLGALGYLLSPHLIQTIIHKLVIYPDLLVPLGIAGVLASSFIWFAQKIFRPPVGNNSNFESACLAAMVSIFITNFYGFSVVTVGILFFMLPVWLIVTQGQTQNIQFTLANKINTELQMWISWIGGGIIVLLTTLVLIFVFNYYQADLAYNYSENYLQLGEVLQADKEIDQALQLHPGNANYWLQKGLVAAQTAFVVNFKDASDSTGLVKHYTGSAVKFTQEALLKNQAHVNLYKSAARVYITLGLIDPMYNQFAIQTLEIARQLSPTDPQIPVNIALLYQQEEAYDKAEALYQQALALKPDYLQAHFLLAQMFEQQKDYQKAAAIYQNVLKTVDPIDINSTKKLQEFKLKKLITD